MTMNRWLGTIVAILEIIVCSYAWQLILKLERQTVKEEIKRCIKDDIAKMMLVIAFLLSVILLISLWSDTFWWLRPRLIAPGPLPPVHGPFR